MKNSTDSILSLITDKKTTTVETAKNLAVVLATRKEASIPASGIGQIKALAALFQQSESLQEAEVLLSVETSLAELEDKNVILLGGPRTNALTAELIQNWDNSNNPYSDVTERIFNENSSAGELLAELSKKEKTTDKTTGQIIAPDYGVILKLTVQGKRVVALFGQHTAGTAAITDYLINDLSKECSNNTYEGDFMAIVAFDVNETTKTVVESTLKYIHPLA